jgi:prophage regulatory protein
MIHSVQIMRVQPENTQQDIMTPTPQTDHARHPAPPQVQRFLRKRDVLAITGLTPAKMYEMIRAEQFPRGRAISPKVIVWLESEIAAWQAAIIDAGLAGAGSPNSRRRRDAA